MSGEAERELAIVVDDDDSMGEEKKGVEKKGVPSGRCGSIIEIVCHSHVMITPYFE